MKGILFRPEIWQAKLRVLEERGEAQTRRVINPQPAAGQGIVQVGYQWAIVEQAENPVDVIRYIKPRYQEGEVAYVKEAGVWEKETQFRAYKSNFDAVAYEKIKWQSPLFMPEWAARYFIRMKVKAQRVQEITEEDAKLEGVCQEYLFKHGLYIEDGSTYRRGYRHLWNSINPKYPFEMNPWEFTYALELVKGDQ